MQRLDKQRCFNHGLREAAARCPSCKRFYCRECVVEHDDRLVCSSCLKKAATEQPKARQVWRPLARVAAVLAMFMFLWFTFFIISRSLSSLPVSVHEDTLWKGDE